MISQLVCLTEPTSPTAEAYRRLRVNLIAPERDAPLRTLLVAAVSPSAEKASVVANLAVTFARAGKKVILADFDLRHPGQHTLFGLANETGVTSAVRQAEVELPLQCTSLPGLRVLTSGPTVEVPSELIASPEMNGLIARMRAQAEMVLFDTPPVAEATDAAELATHVDGVLLTITAGRTKRDDARRAADLLARVGARLVGAVLVNAPAHA